MEDLFESAFESVDNGGSGDRIESSAQVGHALVVGPRTQVGVLALPLEG